MVHGTRLNRLWSGTSWLCVAVIVLSALLPLLALRAQDVPLEEEPEDAALLGEEIAAGWWDKAWKLRRKVSLEGPGLLMARNGVVFLPEPEPLLLANTGRCKDGLADLRVLSRSGAVLPSGAVNLGRDDGSSFIWCRPGKELTGTGLTLYLYYSNPDAKPTGAQLPPGVAPPDKVDVSVLLGPEEACEGAGLPQPPPVGRFFQDFVAAEAEDGRLEGAKAAASDRASAGEFLHFERAGSVSWGLTLPQAGEWGVHLRRAANCPPLALSIGDKKFECGGRKDEPPGFCWDSRRAELSAGKVEVRLSAPAGAGVDTLVLTRDASWRPDYRDLNGPIWMRFRVLRESDQRFYARMYCVHTPYSAKGSLGDVACWMFRGRSVGSEKELELVLRAKDPDRFVRFGEWTAWGRALHSRAYTWYTAVNLLPPGSPGRGDLPLKGLRVAFQFATRPEEGRVFRDGVEAADEGGGIFVRMPTALDFNSLGMTESFGQWAERRFRMAEELGFKGGEGPKTIAAGTMFEVPKSLDELRYVLKTLDWIGMNMAEVHWPDQGELAKLCEENHIRFAYGHTREAYSLDAKGEVPPGATHLDTMKKNLAERAGKLYPPIAELKYYRGPWFMPHLRYTDLADEIGPAVASVQISGHERYKIPRDPFWHECFVEYLKGLGMEPAFFGFDKWDDVVAVDYFRFHPDTEKVLEAAKGSQEAQAEAKEAFDELGLVGEKPDEEVKKLEGAVKVGEVEESKKKTFGDPATADKFEKRLYHHTQKFRSWYTALFYGAVTSAIEKNWSPKIRACVNLQAMPCQQGQMWDGGLNIFDLGRLYAFNCLEVEDWTGSHERVAFGMALLKAAARKRGQQNAALIVGHNPKKRIVANLAQKVHILVFYLYGPVHRIGPVWSEHPQTLREIGEALRMAARTEPDLLAADNRPSDAAILVANTSEMYSVYNDWGFDRERQTLYSALIDGQIPAEVVGEEEIIEDGALERYRALYVGDSHVDSRAQDKIKEWVRGGGTLWASYAALIRQEYDEPSAAFDEVFGLKLRGKVLPIEGRAYGGPAWTVALKGDEKDPDVKLASRCPKPAFGLSTGTPLARFDDGSAAMVYNRFGKGHAFLCGMRLGGVAAPEGQQAGADGRAARVRLVKSAALAGQVRTHVAAHVLGLHTWVHDGPEQTCVFLINESGRDLTDEALQVNLPKAAASAYSGRTGTSDLLTQGLFAFVKLSLPKDECDILVFKP